MKRNFLILAAVLPWTTQAGPAAASAQSAAAGQEDAAATAGHERGRTFQVRRAGAGMRVDGRLDEPAWAAAEAIPLPVEIAPRDNVPAELRTDCRVTFDARNLYLGCRAADPDPSSIRAFVTRRDGIVGNHDRISFLVDPFNDSRRGFVFEVSPLGVQADLVYDERTGGFDASWDGIWESAGRITEDGYVVEAAIPFRTLRFPSTGGVQTWRFWINRMRPRSEVVVTRTSTRLRGESCQLCQAHLLRGFEGMSPGLNVELVPTLTGRRSDSRGEAFPDGPLAGGPVRLEAGLDARWSITSNLALNATVNPDFSQVEADAPQLDANNRFALRFPEKRPFFLEGADLFDTPTEVVFTRSIADPAGGAKLTGKAGAHAVGALAAVDETNNLLLPGPFGSRATSVGERVAAALLRYRRDLGESGTVGGIYTGRLGERDYRNHVAGIDLFLRPRPGLAWSAQALASGSRYDPATAGEFEQPEGAFSGQAAWSRLAYRGRAWSAEAGARLRTPGFRADAGFVPQVDVRGAWLSGGYTHWGRGTLLRRLEAGAGAWHDERIAGSLISEGVWASLSYQGPLQGSAWLNPERRREAFGGRVHDLFGVWAGLELRPAAWLRVGASGNAGDQVDFRNGGKGSAVRLSPSLDAQVGRRGEAGARYSYQRLEKDGARVFTAAVGELRGVYNFSARAFVRAAVQYRRTERDPAANPGLRQPLDESLFTQLLFSYQVNPLTVVFLGFTDDRAGFEDQERSRVELTPRSRTFFLKLGYAWRP